jgi:hypothetical protein
MYYTKHVTLTDNSLSTVLTIPNGYVAHIVYVFVANHGGSTNSIDLKWTNSSNVDQMYLFDGTSINAGSKEILGGQSEAPIFVLHNGDIVKAQASQASGNVEVALTFKLVEQSQAFSNFNGS